MKLETRSLELVLAIADHGTMTQAARHIHLTQSALSHHLLQLEARMQVPLFHRLGRRMLPTPAGQRIVELARRVLPELQAAEEQMAAEAAGRTAVLRLSTECYTTYSWLPRVVAPFRRRHPGVEVRIVAEATAAPLDALRDRQIDLAIVHSDATGADIRTVPLFTDELVLVTAADHPLAGRRVVAAEALQREHLIHYAVRPGETSVAREFLAAAGVMPRRRSSVPLTEAIIEMVKAGLGVTILSRWAVRSHATAGTVATIRLGRDGLYRDWKAALLADQSAVHLGDFVALLAEGPDLARDDAVPA